MIDSRTPFSGRVKFLKNGGNAPVVNNVVQLVYGSNTYWSLYFIGTATLPLNLAQQISQGSTNKSYFTNNLLANFKFWFSQAIVQFKMIDASPEDTIVQVGLTIDDVQSLAPSSALDSGNNYANSVSIDATDPILINQNIYYNILAHPFGTTDPSTKQIRIVSSTTNLFSNVFDEGGVQKFYGVLATHFSESPPILDSATLSISGGFGGSGYLDVNAFQPTFQNSPLTGAVVVGIYIVLSSSAPAAGEFINAVLSVNGSDILNTTFTTFDIDTQLVGQFGGDTYELQTGDIIGLRLDLALENGGEYIFQEIGLIYKKQV